ncbi:hypothetical protein SB766_10145 [Pseudomonas sp. SIMBA_077]
MKRDTTDVAPLFAWGLGPSTTPAITPQYPWDQNKNGHDHNEHQRNNRLEMLNLRGSNGACRVDETSVGNRRISR